jgi:hypothetical protein
LKIIFQDYSWITFLAILDMVLHRSVKDLVINEEFSYRSGAIGLWVAVPTNPIPFDGDYAIQYASPPMIEYAGRSRIYVVG